MTSLRRAPVCFAIFLCVCSHAFLSFEGTLRFHQLNNLTDIRLAFNELLSGMHFAGWPLEFYIVGNWKISELAFDMAILAFSVIAVSLCLRYLKQPVQHGFLLACFAVIVSAFAFFPGFCADHSVAAAAHELAMFVVAIEIGCVSWLFQRIARLSCVLPFSNFLVNLRYAGLVAIFAALCWLQVDYDTYGYIFNTSRSGLLPTIGAAGWPLEVIYQDALVPFGIAGKLVLISCLLGLWHFYFPVVRLFPLVFCGVAMVAFLLSDFAEGTDRTWFTQCQFSTRVDRLALAVVFGSQLFSLTVFLGRIFAVSRRDTTAADRES